jgi:signal transduction histidine kinase
VYKRQASIRNILITITSLLCLLIALLSGRELYMQWQRETEIQALRDASYLGDSLLEIVEKISVERQISYSMLHAPDVETVENLKPNLEQSRNDTDKALKTTQVLGRYSLPDLQAKVNAIENQLQSFKILRPEIDRMVARPAALRDPVVSERWFHETTNAITQTQDLWMAFIRHFVKVDPIVYIHMRFKYFLMIEREFTGRERSLIGRLIVENSEMTPVEQAQLLRWQGIAEYNWGIIHTLADQGGLDILSPALKDAESDYANIDSMVQDIFYVPTLKQKMPYPISAELWLELTTQANDSFSALKDAALKETHRYLSVLEAGAENAIIVNFLILLFTIILCAYSFRIILYRVLRPINVMVGALVGASQGKPVAELQYFGQDDEIGKLAHVLYVFQKNYDELRRSNQELDNFAYIASHDLKEPLRGLSHQAAFLLEDYKDKMEPEAVRRLNNIISLSQRMDKFIHDLLYFSQLGRTELAIQRTNLNEVIGEIQKMMKGFLLERNAHIVIPEPLPTIVCDKIKIAEVFRNLITNAVKYNDKPERIVEVGCKRNVSTSHGMEALVFYVKDNGIGIKAEFHEVIFRIFKRLPPPSIKDEGGTGSGLTFVKKIVERHKGHVWLESEPGKGTTFYFTLTESTAGG